jgi:ribosomal protein S18 acetylase RimI-like enzyme
LHGANARIDEEAQMASDVNPVERAVSSLSPTLTTDSVEKVIGSGSVEIRSATIRDAEEIAALHADSWRRNYRGAYPDTFLDHEVFDDRRDVWRARLTRPEPNHRTVVADLCGEIVGFVHTNLDDDPAWGALLDNLHVAHDMKRRGLGSLLLAACARSVIDHAPTGHLYLWVLEQNTNAQAFYDERGGQCVERQCREPLPDYRLRYVWNSPVHLLDGSETAHQLPNRDLSGPAAPSPTLRSSHEVDADV